MLQEESHRQILRRPVRAINHVPVTLLIVLWMYFALFLHLAVMRIGFVIASVPVPMRIIP